MLCITVIVCLRDPILLLQYYYLQTLYSRLACCILHERCKRFPVREVSEPSTHPRSDAVTVTVRRQLHEHRIHILKCDSCAIYIHNI
jgi:hypothetical protein